MEPELQNDEIERLRHEVARLSAALAVKENTAKDNNDVDLALLKKEVKDLKRNIERLSHNVFALFVFAFCAVGCIIFLFLMITSGN